jgi:branched-chain amino acid transport system ATP-binding protein
MNARDGVVFMPGGRGIFPNLSVEENLRAAAWMQREDENFVRESIDRALENFPELRSRLGEKTGNLSGGEQQMVALSQALLMKPRLLMIDELSLGLAPAVVERLLEIVRQINDAGTTVILVEQSVNVALTLAGRSVFMDKGEIHFDGPTEDLLRREDLVRSVFLAGAGGGGGGAFVASGSGLRRAAWSQEREQVLAAEGLVVRFGGLTVLNGVHLDLAGSEVLGIIGPNGAGKTTLFDTLSGYVKAAAGTVLITGQEATDLPPYARARLGLGRSFQNARLFPSLTVRENVAVALEQHLAVRNVVLAAAWAPTARRSEKRAFRRVNYLLELLNLEDFGDKFVNELSTGTRRMVDIACIMASEPRVLLLDEPSSGLAQAEVEVLAPVIRRLAKETGCGVLVIEHDIPLVRGLSDRMMAMVQGQVIVEGSPSDVVNDKRIVEAYLGASQATINRSGALLAPALAALGLEKESPR